MRLPLRIFAQAFLVLRPSGFPVDEMDPPTFLVGIAMAGLLWIEEIKGWFGRGQR